MRFRAVLKICAGVIVAGALGCTTTVPRDDSLAHYGNFGGLTAEYELAIAKATAQQMLMLYAPARARLNLRQPTPDAFGVVLVANLREHGYAVSEYAGPAPARGTENPERMNRDQRADAGVDFRYILDHPDPDLYRVTVFVAGQSLSRAYTTNRGRLVPYGSWVLKE